MKRLIIIFIMFSLVFTFSCKEEKKVEKTKTKLTKQELQKKLSSMMKKISNNLDKAYEKYKEEKEINPKFKNIRPRIYGKKDTKYNLTVFSDFSCGHCKRANKLLKQRVDENKDLVNLTYIFFPLNKDCNYHLKGKLSDFSCVGVKLSLCAEKQGKVWEGVDYVYNNRPNLRKFKTDFNEKEFILKMEKDLKLKNLDKCYKSNWVKERIKKENDVYKGIKIPGTPIITLNKKRIGGVYKTKDIFKNFLKRIEKN
jgi:protein-disulfide isomerase